MQVIGTYGLKNKREVWRVMYMLAKLRKAARELLTLEESDPRRIFEGDALLRRMTRLGLLKPSERKLDYVLGLTTEQFMDRRLQTVVAKRQLGNTVHHARVLIRQKHIAVGKQIVNIPSYMVRVSSEQHIQRASTSVFKTGENGRTKKKKAAAGKGGDDE